MVLSRNLGQRVSFRNAARYTTQYPARPTRRLPSSHAYTTVTSFPATMERMTNVNAYTEKLQQNLGVTNIHRYYPALVKEIQLLQKSVKANDERAKISLPLGEPELHRILESLATSGRPEDLQRIEVILGELYSVFGIQPSLNIQTSILRGLVKHGNATTVQRWLSNMPRLPGNLTPTHDQFHMALEGCIEFASFKFLRFMVISMRKCGCRPVSKTFEILIRARWKKVSSRDNIPHLVAFESLIKDMQLEGLLYDETIESTLYNGYLDQDMKENAEKIREIYRNSFLVALSPAKSQRREWENKLSATAQTKGIRAALDLSKSLVGKEWPTCSSALKALLRHSTRLEDLRLVENELQVKCSRAEWSLLINNNVRAGHLVEALDIYDQSKSSTIEPDAAMVAPLMTGLCASSFKPPSDSMLDEALRLYNELVDVAPPDVIVDKPKTNYNQHAVGPDFNIYHTLLRGLASSSNQEKYYPILVSLLGDMKTRGISTADSHFASTLIVVTMRRAKNAAEALDAYHHLRSSLDEKGYEIVLSAFSKLTFGDSTYVPSLQQYFSIVRDMRQGNIPITIKVYTIILSQIGLLSTRISRGHIPYSSDYHSQLVLTTRRTHDFLTLDASVSPDAHIWNQLMDTYQRLGCFADAYRVWDLMYLTGRFDNISVSIILDACGYASAWHVAKRICGKLFRDNFVFDMQNWNTWLECLCRLGRLNDAMQVACTEMGKVEHSTSPNVESARILIKFSRKEGKEADVQARLKTFLPELWQRLPDDLK